MFTAEQILEADRVDYNINVVLEKQAKEAALALEKEIAANPGKFQCEFVNRMSQPKRAPESTSSRQPTVEKSLAQWRQAAFATSGGLYLRRLQQSEKDRTARAQAQNLQIQR